MGNLILSTKNTNNTHKTRGIIGGSLQCIVGLLFIIIYMFFSQHSSSPMLTLFLLASLIFFVEGFVTIALRVISCKSYVDIFEDRIQGKGINKLDLLDFNLSFNQISSISISDVYIHINAGPVTYKIISDKETAARVYNYYYNGTY